MQRFRPIQESLPEGSYGIGTHKTVRSSKLKRVRQLVQRAYHRTSTGQVTLCDFVRQAEESTLKWYKSPRVVVVREGRRFLACFICLPQRRLRYLIRSPLIALCNCDAAVGAHHLHARAAFSSLQCTRWNIFICSSDRLMQVDLKVWLDAVTISRMIGWR
jgi:hypothetical protein